MSKTARALIFDDEELVGLTLKGMLSRAGIESRWTADSDQYAKHISEFRPTIIFVDLSMPEVDGVSLLIRLSETAPEIPIALISGTGRKLLDAAKRSAEEHGLTVTAVLAKPVRSEQVINAALSLDEDQAELHRAKSKPDEGPEWLLSGEQVRVAIEQEQIRPFFQPKIDCHTERMIGVEVLARWILPSGKCIFPNEFIRIAEEEGLVTHMTLSLARQAFAWMREAGFDDLSISLNISALSLDSEDFLDQFKALVDEYEFRTSQVILELTETSAQNMMVNTLDLFTRFSLLGFKLSMDDFGTGYSSVAALTRMPFDEIKIDRQFIIEMQSSEAALAVVETVIALCQRLKLTCVAEGVEDQETFRRLRDAGCDAVQGFLFGQPEPGDELTRRWLPEHSGGRFERKIRADQSPLLMRQALDASYDAIVITDTTLDSPEILYVNPAFCRMTGYAPDEVIGKTPKILQGPDTDHAATRRLKRALAAGQSHETHAINYRKDGSPFYLQWRTSPILDSQGRVSHYMAIQRDVTDQIHLMERLQYEARIDALTGLLNRRAGEEELSSLLKQAQAQNEPVSLILLAIDSYQQICEVEGEWIGDCVIRRVARIIDGRTRSNDRVIRWSEGRFAVVLWATAIDGAMAVAESIRRAVESEQIENIESLTVSHGVVEWQGEEKATELTDRADQRLRGL
jgi:diguanylate cyclase (GGDEF)-like protein/PAS domain S-box-containing protein